MRKVSFGKRLISMVLALVMILGMAPVADISGWFTKAQAAGSDPIYVLAGGDFQAGDNGQVDHYYSRINMGNILDKIKEKYSTMNGFIFVGDYDGDTHNDSNANAGVAAMMEEVSERFNTLNHGNSYLIEGNHETGAVSGIDATGGYDCDGYAVYLINETDFCERQEGKSAQIQTVADNLKTWLNNKIGEGYEAPIFVATHTPLGYTTRTYTNGDSLYGKYVFDVLNNAAANGLNIIFMHGHDHAYGADNYLGGEAIYLPVGDKINICVPGDKTKWTEETLNFTYMNAGYVGYYNENYYNYNSYEAEKLTMTVFKIENNQVTVERWSKDGLYNLKSKGREGFYSNASTCANIGLSYNTTVYTSPQTITLVENSAADMGTIGEWVEVEAETTDDVTTSGNGWVQITAPSTGTVYRLTDTLEAGKKYVIVNRNTVGTGNAVNLNGSSINSTSVEVKSDSNGAYIEVPSTTAQWTYTSNKYFQSASNASSYLRGRSSTGSLRVGGTSSTYRTWNYSSTYGLYGSNSNYSVNSSFSLADRSSTNRVYIYVEETQPATNGVWYKIVDNKSDNDFSYDLPVGASTQQALDTVYDGVTVYKYEGTTAPTTSTTGTAVSDSDVTWTLASNYSGSTAGDYAVTITKDGKTLGTAEVVVPATKTYYIAEGNGFYLVDMNTTADNAMAAVKAGIAVYSATDASGTGKTAISDDDVTWKWVDTYNGADSGPYTVEILKDGTSLGTVEVKVNVKYTTGIETDWTYIGESEATGGSYTYTLDTDGIDAGKEHKYIIVARNQAYLLNAGSAVAVTISSDGKTATTSTRDYEYYFTGSTGGLITRDGTNTLYQQNWGIHTGYNETANLDAFVNLGSGYYRLYDNDSTARSLYYGTNSNVSSNAWTVTESNHDNSQYSVRLYKYTGTTGGTGGGSIYALIEGNEVYTVDQGTSATKALAAVKAGITGYLASDANGTDKTELDDSKLTWKWLNTYNGNSTGSYWVEISYEGEALGIVEVQVKPSVIKNYPEYPDEGAVKVNKTATGIQFQSSGVAQVELSASGVPSKKGVDVIIMLDTSSSMTSHTVTGSTKTRAEVLEESLANLITQFKTPGDDGELLDIQVAIADFNGFNGYGGTTGTPYDRDENDNMSDNVKYTANGNYGQVFTGDRSLSSGAFISVEDLTFDGLQVDNATAGYKFGYHSGTNYDYAMDAIYQMATAKKLANGGEERDLYVIFMSDGAAMQWNYYHSQGASSLWNNWITGAWDADDLTSDNLNCTAHKHYYNLTDTNGDGMLNEHWMANAIKGDPTQVYKVIRKTATLGTAVEGEANMYMVAGLGAKMFSISFDAQTDTNVTEESMDKSIETLASPQTGTTKYYYKVTSADELTAAFTVIGTEIAYAANNARFVDQMGTNFNLQMTPIVDYAGNAITDNNGNAMLPSIEIISYDIWTRADYEAKKCTIDQIGVRKGTFTVLETITFTSVKNTDGSYTVTGAYSDQIGGGATNILADGTQTGYVKGVIYAKTFIYNTNAIGVAVDGVSIPVGVNTDGTTNATTTNVLPAETFYWKLGTVQTSELAMRYYVYLDGSMEGTRPAGSYATNNYAILYYDNYLGNSCLKETVSPVMAWKSANVSYAFYLVNEKGEIIVNQTTGETGTFANKIAVTNPVVYKEIMLNNTDQVQSINVAAISDNVLPKYYNLYDEGAVYEIHINSDATGNWVITKGDVSTASTYVTNYTLGTAYSNALTEKSSAYDYTHTVVWFAVVWTVEAHPDSVVVDFGLPVDISVLANDMFGDYGKLAGIGPYYLKDEAGNLTGETNEALLTGHQNAMAGGFGNEWTGNYGTAKVDMNTGEVRYTLNTMQMNSYEKFVYAVNYTNTTNPGYYYDSVTVIPATTIYYEDSFLDYSYDVWSEADNAWVDYTGSDWKWVFEANDDKAQDEDRPGKYSLTDANNIYGYDSINLGMSQYSLNGFAKATVDYDHSAVAEFTFSGTGFDVISMTNSTTGTILVDILKDNETVEQLVVDTYYGYKQENGKWIVDPAATDSLYQVPVIKWETDIYGTYTVKIRAQWDPIFEHVDGSADYDFYLDAIRIYDPANDGASDGTTDTTIEDAYMADGEGWPTYFELRNHVIDANTFGNYDADSDADGDVDTSDVKVTGVVFIDGDDEVGNDQIKDYISYGPNNEVYLAPGQRVAFILGGIDDNVANVHIGISSANGEKGTYTITNIAQNTNDETGVAAGTYYGAKTSTIDTTTDMYYDLTGWKNDIIVISNTGNREEYNTTGIISLTNIKFTYKSNPYATSNTGDMDQGDEATMETTATVGTVYMTASAAALTLRALNTPEVEKTPVETVPEETVPEETVPEETVPEETVPEETVPEETVPEETVPEETVPEETVPEETVPEETVPEETVPEETVPEETVPEETVPEEDSAPTDTDTGIIRKLVELIGKLIDKLFGWLFD